MATPTTYIVCAPGEGQTSFPCPDGQVMQAYVGAPAFEPAPYDPAVGQQIITYTIGPVLTMYLISRFGGELIGLFRR